jgi:hypothetical protein
VTGQFFTIKFSIVISIWVRGGERGMRSFEKGKVLGESTGEKHLDWTWVWK